jgi:metal-sulfur cluster biosynthetic enzyme
VHKIIEIIKTTNMEQTTPHEKTRCNSCSSCSNKSSSGIVKGSETSKELTTTMGNSDWNELDSIDIFEAIRDIKDPEHPCTLEELNVIGENSVVIGDVEAHGMKKQILIEITPTVKHCSLVTDISLCILTRLRRIFGDQVLNNYKIDLKVANGSHENEAAVIKQINDKERVAAALENPLIMQIIENCIENRAH